MSIILDKINYSYSEGTAYQIQALKNVNLEIKDGQFIGVIGHTGSGKSTLTQLLNGLLKATSGHIYVDGEDIYDEDYDMKKLRNKVGLVFQYPDHQLFETTNFEDVCFGPKNQGLDRKTIELRAYEALRQVKFPEDLYYQPPFDLSGGQKRRAQNRGTPCPEQAFQEAVHRRQHQDPDHRAGEAPAEGGHTEKQNAEGQKLLAERRMGDLIRPDAVQMFPGRPGMIDRVEVRGVQEVRDRRNKPAFIRQLRNG